ncbi:MAG: hypothetical protein AB8F95_16040 [Bacteroidia bacterium]
MKYIRFCSHLIIVSILSLFFNEVISQNYSYGEYLRDSTRSFHPLSDSGASLTFQDRFGNRYHSEEILIPISPSGGGPQPLSAGHSNFCTSGKGYFRIFFEDVMTNNTQGFDELGAGITGGTLGQERQDVICQVFNDLEALLDQSTTRTSNDPVNIHIATSGNYQNMPNTIAAGDVYMANLGGNGIIDDPVWVTLHSGVDYYDNFPSVFLNNVPGVNSQYYHGYIKVNFDPIIPWNNIYSGFNSTPVNELDLYSATLHQALHILGIRSALFMYNQNSSNQYIGSRYANGGYHRYDRYLTDINGNSLVDQIGCYSMQVNQSPGSFTPGCTNAVLFDGAYNTNQQVYSPSSFYNGISLSHFLCETPGQSCSNNYSVPFTDHVMTVCTGLGPDWDKRSPNQQEVNTLCDLGYITSGVYGVSPSNVTIFRTYNLSCNPCVPIGVHDFDNNANSPHYTDWNTPTLIPNVLANDLPQNAGLQLTCVEVLGTSGGTASAMNNGGIYYTPASGYIGWVIIRYRPEIQNCEMGNWTYVFIHVGTPTGSSTMPSCAPCVDCSVQNIVCGGDLEHITNFFSVPHNRAFIENRLGAFPSSGPYFPFVGPELYPSFFGNYGSPLAGGANTTMFCNNPQTTGVPLVPCPTNAPCNPGVNSGQFVGLFATENGIRPLNFELCKPLVSGEDYIISYRTYNGCNGNMNFVFSESEPCQTSRISTVDYQPISPYPFIGMSPVATPCAGGGAYQPRELARNAFPATLNSSGTALEWQQHSFLYTATSSVSGIKHLIVHPDPIIFNNGSATPYILIDDISVQPANNYPFLITATPPVTSTCPNQNINLSYQIDYLGGGFPANGLDVEIPVPAGFTVVSPGIMNGPVNGSLIANVPFSQFVGNQLTINITVSATPVVSAGSYGFRLDFPKGGCQVAGSQAESIVEIDPFVTFTRTMIPASPIPGQVVTVSFEVCSRSNATLNGLFIEEVHPTQFQFMSSASFSIVGTAGTNLKSSFFNLPAASTASPVCTTLTYNAFYGFGENHCDPVSFCAELQALPCPLPTNCVSVDPRGVTRDIGTPGTTTLSSSINPPIQPGEVVALVGDLEIDQNMVIWQGVTMFIDPNISILVPNSPAVLHLTQGTELLACNHMWNGITVDGAGKLFVDGNSIISDAYVGITSKQGGATILDQAIMDMNEKHMVFWPYANPHPASITGSQFLCNSSLKKPLAGRRTSNAIEVNQVENLNIGNQGTSNQINTSYYGIVLNQSSAEIRNTVISHVYFNCVRANGANSPSPVNNDILISNCEFFEWGLPFSGQFAVWIEAAYNVQIMGQNFIHDNITPSWGGGIRVRSNPSINPQTVSIIDNTIENAGADGIHLQGVRETQIHVTNNKVNSLSTPKGYWYGILAYDNGPTPPPNPRPIGNPVMQKVFSQNTVKRAQNGMYLARMRRLEANRNTIETQQIQNSRGIVLESNFNNTNVSYNEVTNNVQNPTQQGVFMRNNRDLRLHCNIVDDAGQAYVFDQNNAAVTTFWGGTRQRNALLVQNQSNNSVDGWVIQQNSLIGHQGNPNGIIHGNTWFNVQQWEINNIIPNNVINLYIGNPPLINTNPSQINGNVNITSNSPFTMLNCPDIENLPESTMPVFPASWELDSISTDVFAIINGDICTDDNLLYVYRRYLFETMRADTLLDQLLALDPGLASFYNSWSNSPSGGLVDVADQVLVGNVHAAWYQNSTLSSTIPYEMYEQSINDIYLGTMLGFYSLDSIGVRAVLEPIAQMCPYDAGPSQGRARTMLQTWQRLQAPLGTPEYIFPEKCEQGQAYRFQEISDPNLPDWLQTEEKDWGLSLSPNPANDRLLIQYDAQGETNLYFALMDISGRIVIDQKLSPEVQGISMSIEALPPGLYYATWRLHGKLLKGQRQLIVR